MTTPAPNTPPDLDVAIIARDAERTIGRTIDSVRTLARRVVVVDSGSTDRTIEIARAHGATVEHQDWLGFVGQKNAAIDRCEATWILSLDADESLDDAAREAIRAFIESNDASSAGATLNRRVLYHGNPLRRAWQPDRLVRLVRRGSGRWVGGAVHERLQLDADATPLDGNILHDTLDPLDDFLRRQIDYATLAAQDTTSTGRRASVGRLVCSPLVAWFKQIALKGGWRDGRRGFVAAGCAANAALTKQLMLHDRAIAHDKDTNNTPHTENTDG